MTLHPSSVGKLSPATRAAVAEVGPVGTTSLRASARRTASAPWPGHGQPIFGRRSAVSPSLRLRVNAANRSLLRWLRAAELAAWEDADAGALPAPNRSLN